MPPLGPTLLAHRYAASDERVHGAAAIDAAMTVLRDEGIVAIKALGGFTSRATQQATRPWSDFG